MESMDEFQRHLNKQKCSKNPTQEQEYQTQGNDMRLNAQNFAIDLVKERALDPGVVGGTMGPFERASPPRPACRVEWMDKCPPKKFCFSFFGKCCRQRVVLYVMYNSEKDEQQDSLKFLPRRASGLRPFGRWQIVLSLAG